MFPSLSQMSILNQHYHFNHDCSKRNLQQALLPRERDTETGKTPQTHNPMQTPTQPAQELCCCHQRRSVRRDVYTAPGLTEKTFLLCHEIPPAALSRVLQLPFGATEPLLCHPSGGERVFSKGWQVTETATTSQNAPYSHCQAKHTQQEGKEQPWGDTHPNTQTMSTKPTCTKNTQKIFPLTKARADGNRQDVGLESPRLGRGAGLGQL